MAKTLLEIAALVDHNIHTSRGMIFEGCPHCRPKRPSWLRQLRKTIKYARGYDASRRTVAKILWRQLWT